MHAVSIHQITTLAAAGESETVEFKETTGTRREATMTVCAFLNQEGGQALFGITPDGAVVGQQVSERQVRTTLDKLRNRGLVVLIPRGPLSRWKRADGA